MKKILLGLLILGVALATGCTSSAGYPITTTEYNTTTSISTSNVAEVKIAQSIIDSAIEETLDKPNFGINLATVRINYVKGVTVVGAVVIHNGNDAERLVTVTYTPVKDVITDTSNSKEYQKSPVMASGWVSVDTKSIRMGRSESKAITVRMTVPKKATIDSKYWSFYVNVTGTTIRETTQDLVNVETVENDHTLYLRLASPLLDGDVGSVKMSSTLPEDKLYIDNYLPDSTTLVIGGLVELSNREMSVSYEYGEMVQIGYNQRWLITML